MKTIVIKTQAELDALPAKFDEYTIIEIHATERISVSVKRENSSVEARENSSVEAWENSSVVAWGNSSVVAWGNSSVEARENSSVVAWGNSSVVAWGNSSVEARGNSSVVAWGNSSVVARENSSVVAWENSSVEARGNSSVVAWENSSVVAWGNSSVVAWENCGVHAQSEFSSIALFGYSVCWLIAKCKCVKKSKTATIIKPKQGKGVEGWLEAHGIENRESVVIFKRVSSDWKTQEGTKNETVWAPGTTIEHQAWDPREECGAGKFHGCATPYFCDEFRSVKRDRYVAIEVAKKDLHAHDNPEYPHKISFRAGKVLHEVNRMGKRI